GGLEVDYQLVLCRRLHRKVGGLFALEDAIDVAGRAAVRVDRVGAVRDEAAAGGVEAIPVDRRQLVASRKCDDQLAMHQCEPARCDDQPPLGAANEGSHCALDLARVADIDRLQFPPERRRNCLDGTQLAAAGSLPGIRNTATRVRSGAISLSSSNHFPPMPYSVKLNPVALPPGRARLSTKPPPTGSPTFTNTIGTARVASSKGDKLGLPVARMTSGASAISSAAYLRTSSVLVGQRVSMRTLWPSIQPNFPSPPRNAAMRALPSASSAAVLMSTPMHRILPRCCARAASGHAAALPRSVMNSRRFMCGWPPPGKRSFGVQRRGRLQSCVDGPRLARDHLACSAEVACSHVSGLLVQSGWTAGPDGVREPSPHHSNGIDVPMKRQVWLGCVGSTDCAITRHCSLASSRTWLSGLSRRGHALVVLMPVHHRPGDARGLVG